MKGKEIHRKILWYIVFFLSLEIFPQSQEEILRDLQEDVNPYQNKDLSSKQNYLEELRAIYLKVAKALEKKEDKLAIEQANQMERSGITPDSLELRQSAELTEGQILYFKIRRLRAEAFYNIRAFRNALSDSQFIVENYPRPVIFDYTRYAVSLYYSGDPKKANQILKQARGKFKNENDQIILQKTNLLLFPDS